jgi:hypothetical protein
LPENEKVPNPPYAASPVLTKSFQQCKNYVFGMASAAFLAEGGMVRVEIKWIISCFSCRSNAFGLAGVADRAKFTVGVLKRFFSKRQTFLPILSVVGLCHSKSMWAWFLANGKLVFLILANSFQPP